MMFGHQVLQLRHQSTSRDILFSALTQAPGPDCSLDEISTQASPNLVPVSARQNYRDPVSGMGKRLLTHLAHIR